MFRHYVAFGQKLECVLLDAFTILDKQGLVGKNTLQQLFTGSLNKW